jgi:hypothetical protein
MYAYSGITNTLVPITITHKSSTALFRDSAIKTIPSLTVVDGGVFTNWFHNCSALENITFNGVISRDLQLQYSSLLSVETMKSAIEHLKNYKGTSSDQTYSILFTDDCWARLEETTPPNGYGTWRDYVSDLGWAV